MSDVDWRVICGKYMALIGYEEGVSFLSCRPGHSVPGAEFTDAEWAAIKELEAEE